MESVYIKQVPTCEVNKLVYFINMHWKHNHSLAVSRELLNFCLLYTSDAADE